MAYFKVPKIEIKGISACVPPTIEKTTDIPFYSAEEAIAVAETTGVIQKHITSAGVTASDLCLKAAEELLSQLEWSADSIDILCFVTQTQDYFNHPNGFVIHERLGLSQECVVLDLFHGCPGWVMGLSTITSIMSHAGFKRGILLDGDVVTMRGYKNSRESRPLFGDAGTATALVFNTDAQDILFDMGTNSQDGKALITKRGMAREPFDLDSFQTHYELLQGLRTTEEVDDAMDGMSVFSFGISKPPKSIKRLIENFNLNKDEIDKFVLHQANKLMLDRIIKKLKINSEKAPIGLTYFGNTTSASIPLAIVTECRDEYSTKHLKTICCGFGTGLSWASAYFETDKIVCPPVITY